jgi:hypothetical protein
MVNLWSGIELVLFHMKGCQQSIYVHLWQTLICLFCKRRLYLSVPPSLAISTPCCTIGYDINRTMTVVTERAVMEPRLGCQEMAGRI